MDNSIYIFETSFSAIYTVASFCSLLDNNDLLGGFSPEINELNMLSESQVDEKQLTNADKMQACTGRYITRYVIRHLKGGPL